MATTIKDLLQVVGEQMMLFLPLLPNDGLGCLAKGVCIASCACFYQLPQYFSARHGRCPPIRNLRKVYCLFWLKTRRYPSVPIAARTACGRPQSAALRAI